MSRPARGETEVCRTRHDLEALPNLLAEPVRAYEARYGVRPGSLEVLLAEGLINYIPVDPLGRPYVLSFADNGAIVVGLAGGQAAPSWWRCVWAQVPRPAWLLGLCCAAGLVGAVGLLFSARKSLFVALLVVAVLAVALLWQGARVL